jgi:hypothetical protein
MGDSSYKLLSGPGLQKCKVSSVLNGMSEFGGKNMFDGDDSTCWNSDQVLRDLNFRKSF